MQLRSPDSRSREGVGKVSKNFFFEKKKQKTFAPLRAVLARCGRAGREPKPTRHCERSEAIHFSRVNEWRAILQDLSGTFRLYDLKKALLLFLLLASCAAPHPQYGVGTALSCVPYAREVSGIQLAGDAWQWWDEAAGLYPRAHTPARGAVIVFAPHGSMTQGHLAVVTALDGARAIRVTQANWLPRRIESNQPVIDVSPTNDWSEVRVWYEPAQTMGATIYPVYGFILPR